MAVAGFGIGGRGSGKKPGSGKKKSIIEQYAEAFAAGSGKGFTQPGAIDTFPRNVPKPPKKTTGDNDGGDDGWNAFRDYLLAQAAAGAGGSGGYVVPFSETQAGLELRARQMEEAAANQRAWEAEQAQILAAATEKARLDQLAGERAGIFAQMFGIDPVRAILFGKNVAGDLVTGASRFGELGALAGVGQRETQTEDALRKALTGVRGVGNVDINEQGVAGLPSVESVAKQVAYGGGDIGTLLRSAFGVGNQGLGGGVSTEEFQRRIMDVTPTGAIQ